MASSKDIRSMKIPEERSNGHKKLSPIKFVRDSSNLFQKELISKTITVATRILLEDAHNGFKNGNFVCSPFSLTIVLGMLAAGAQGKTLEQLLEFLGDKSIDKLLSETSPTAKLSNPSLAGGGPDIGLTNGIWIDKKLNRVQSCYKEIMNSVYSTKPKFVDFENIKTDDESPRKINSWVNKKFTRGLIPTIVEGGDSEGGVVFALTNALYFKGLWLDPFDKNYTKKKDFHLMNGVTVQVPFMTSFDEYSWYGSLDSYDILRIPYERHYQSKISFSMYIFLPNKKDGLQDLVQKFHSDPKLFHRFPLSWTQLDELRIPKFKISNNFEPIKAMKQMGLTLPFEPMNMELYRILDSRDLDSSDMPFYVSKILQKSFIEIEEKGTEATAFSLPTTKLRCGSRKTPPQPLVRPKPSFVADHPFMFMIKEGTYRGAVLYIGVVLDPNA